jgi:hypothetical protein
MLQSASCGFTLPLPTDTTHMYTFLKENCRYKVILTKLAMEDATTG